jgi:hypothetical protein
VIKREIKINQWRGVNKDVWWLRKGRGMPRKCELQIANFFLLMPK